MIAIASRIGTRAGAAAVAHAEPFRSAEEAWFWTMAALIARRDGARYVAGLARAVRPCEPDDAVKCLDRLWRQRRNLRPLRGMRQIRQADVLTIKAIPLDAVVLIIGQHHPDHPHLLILRLLLFSQALPQSFRHKQSRILHGLFLQGRAHFTVWILFA